MGKVEFDNLLALFDTGRKCIVIVLQIYLNFAKSLNSTDFHGIKRRSLSFQTFLL